MTSYNGYTFTNLSSGDTISDPDGFTNPSNATDDNDVTTADLTTLSAGSEVTKTLGTTYTSATITVVRVKANIDMNLGSTTYAGEVKLQGYDGSTWFDILSLGTTTTQTLVIDTLVKGGFLAQGLRIAFVSTVDSGNNIDMDLFTLSYGTSFTYTPKYLLPELGGTALEDLSDKTAIAEDHTLTWRKMLKNSLGGQSQNAYQTLQANNIFENKDNLAADEFLTIDGTNNTVLLLNPSGPFVVIEATSVHASFASGNVLIREYGTGKWIVYSVTVDPEVARAEIYSVLFYSNRATSTYITGLTALKTSITRDVGKQAHYATFLHGDGAASTNFGYFTGTFANTTTNTACSSWSYINGNEQNRGPNSYGQWEIPSGSTKHQVILPGSVNEIGTDTTTDEVDNPAGCQLQIYYNNLTSGNDDCTIRALVLCEGDITWVASGFTGGVSTEVDFFTDHSVPLLTATTETPFGTTALYEDYGVTDAYTDIYATDSNIGTDTTEDPDSFTNPSNAFDSDDTTYAEKIYVGGTTSQAWEFGKTFSAKTIKTIKYNIYRSTSSAGPNQTCKIQTYNGTTWDDVETIFAGYLSGSTTYTGYIGINASVQGVRLEYTATNMGGETVTLRPYTLEYGEYTGTGTLTTETLPLDGTEDSIGVYYAGTFPTNTGMTLLASDGVNETTTLVSLSAKSKIALIDITSLSAGTLQVQGTFTTTDGAYTAEIKGDGLRLVRD